MKKQNYIFSKEQIHEASSKGPRSSLWRTLTWEVMFNVTVSRPPDSMPWVSASVSVTLASPPTPDEDMTRFWVEMADGDIGVVEGRLPFVGLSSKKRSKINNQQKAEDSFS